MKSGDRVYRVVIPRPSNEREQHHPRIESVEVIGIGPAKIQLRNNFSDLFKQQVPARYLGEVFFVTEREAYEGFIREKREKLEDLQREMDRTAQLIIWADGKLKDHEV